MDKIANTLTIDIYAEASCPNAEYNVGIDDVGQITITPIDAGCNFTFVSREPTEDKISIHLTANMTSTDDNFEYFLDIDEIGQIIVTPDSENSNFESVTEGADLNLVTESHFRLATEGEDLDEDVEADGEPYTREQVEADLKSLTMNWTREDTLKTTFEVEHQYAMEILSKHYDTVYDEGKQGSWYYVRFVGPLHLEEGFRGSYKNDLIEMVEEGLVDPKKMCVAFIKWLSEDELHDFNRIYEYIPGDINEGYTSKADDYYTREDVESIREKFRKWGFKVDSQHPGFDRYTCKVNDYLLECVFDHKFGTPEEKCFTARVLLNRKTMDYFFNAEDALDFMLANAENRVLDEELGDKLSPSSSSDMNELENIARAHNVTILSPMKDGELRLAGTLKDLKAFYADAGTLIGLDEGELVDSKQGECAKCSHVLTDGGQCPVCDLGDEDERTSHTLYDINETYYLDNKEIMSEVSKLGKELEGDGFKFYGDKDAGGTYYDFYTKPGDTEAVCKAVKYNYKGAQIIDITIDQLIGKDPLDSFDGMRRKLGRILLPQNEAMASSEAMEMLKIAREIGINNGEDLIRFYQDHPAADEDKLATIQSYRKELGPDFKLEEGSRVSFDLDGKNYRGIYRGQSTTNPDMADVEIDDDCYENPDPYGRHINRRPIYNRHEDRYIKDGKFFIPNRELRFEED